MSTPVRMAALVLGLLAAACTSIVVPPRAVRHPTTVFLLREAMHIGVVLPADDGAGADPRAPTGWVEYGFGEWTWYAEQGDAWYRVFPAMLWPTAGTLSRRDWAPATAADFPARAAARGCRADPLVVEAAATAALRERLDRAFTAGNDRRAEQVGQGMAFVPADALGAGGYWLLRTCADVAAGWFRELGCSVTWAPVRRALAPAAPRRQVEPEKNSGPCRSGRGPFDDRAAARRAVRPHPL
ncbi:MAG: hypothetical protein AB7O97_15265 [Planctomycetota bacterium]